jgi:hypothetical protein
MSKCGKFIGGSSEFGQETEESARRRHGCFETASRGDESMSQAKHEPHDQRQGGTIYPLLRRSLNRFTVGINQDRDFTWEGLLFFRLLASQISCCTYLTRPNLE